MNEFDRIVFPNFTLGPPNFYSMREKQALGLCPIHGCQEKFDPDNREGRNFLFCDKHRKRLESMFARIERLDLERDLRRLNTIMKNP